MLEHDFMYVNRMANIEFDIRTGSGYYLYSNNLVNLLNVYNKTDLSLFMMRSYN
jgi:hypothetical protein